MGGLDWFDFFTALVVQDRRLRFPDISECSNVSPHILDIPLHNCQSNILLQCIEILFSIALVGQVERSLSGNQAEAARTPKRQRNETKRCRGRLNYVDPP